MSGWYWIFVVTPPFTNPRMEQLRFSTRQLVKSRASFLHSTSTSMSVHRCRLVVCHTHHSIRLSSVGITSHTAKVLAVAFVTLFTTARYVQHVSRLRQKHSTNSIRSLTFLFWQSIDLRFGGTWNVARKSTRMRPARRIVFW